MSADLSDAIMRETWTYTINLIAAAVNLTTPPEKSDDITWENIIEFAKEHRVLNIIAYSVEKLTRKPDLQTAKYLREFMQQKMVVEAQQEIEASDAMNKLEELHVRNMPLKGYVVKNLYPSPDMRTMSDIDILIDPNRCDEVLSEFTKDGFNFVGEGDLHSNVERGNAYIEFHRSMVNKKYTRMYEYFGDGFSRAVKTEGYEWKYELKKEDMYVFLLAHVAKHYRYSGTGIRTILDLYVYRKACPDMDFEYIKEQTELLGISDFQSKMEKLADTWFSGSFDGIYDNVSEYIASGGIYGNKENLAQNSFIADTLNDSSFHSERRHRILQMIFPDMSTMCIRYPILKNHRLLLPLFWIVRVFDTLIHTPKNIGESLKASSELMKVNEDKIDIQRDAGINDYKTKI